MAIYKYCCSFRVLMFSILFGLTFVRVDAQTVEARIDTFLNQMTTEEKILQLHQEGSFNTATNTRLGIPGFVMSDGPHGVRDDNGGNATSFPVGIGMASMWDVDLAQRIGVAMGNEFRGKRKNQALGPCLDIDRDPRNGRSPETGGEDPYLCAQITTAVVKGIQSTPCIATTKHYNCNHRENGRFTNDIIAARRVLNEPAGLAFRTAVQQGGAMCVMNAINLINDEWCAENHTLLTTILRTQWGFPFYVVSDWGSITNSERAIKAGCDICMGSSMYQNDLPGLVSSGAISDSIINEAVRHVLRTKIFAGMLDYQPSGDINDVNSTDHQQLCLEAGQKSIVLLKNQNQILPISKYINSIALIGPSAAVAQIDGGGSSYVTPYYTINPKQGIENKIGTEKVLYAKGCDINSTDTSGFAAAVNYAKSADIVIYCGGLDPTQEGEGADRLSGSTSLPGKQQDLINALAFANSNLVVTIFSGGICTLDRCIDTIKGLIYAFYPGQEGGNALANVLFGDYNPGGKLPVTMPKSDAQLPEWNDNFNDDYGCGYRWYDKMGYVPQFAFGFGLSYTNFSYSNLKISPTSVAPGELVTIQVDVTNSGIRTGDEVVQLYLSHPSSSLPMPTKELKAFKRVTLDAGQTATAEFTLTANELYYYNETSNTYEVEAGRFTIRVGGSSDNLPLSDSFEVRDDTRKPDLLIANVRMVPPYPLPGQKVVFYATVKNQGTAPTIAGSPLKISFGVNSQQVSWSDEFTNSIPAGGMALICGNAGPNGVNTWTASTVGTFNMEATADPDNTVDECVKTNNIFTSQFSVWPFPLQNLALHKSVIVSSVKVSTYKGTNAVDGNMNTFWTSAYSDPQFIIVDLGAKAYINNVVLRWGTYAKEYYLQISDDTLLWTDVKRVTNSNNGEDNISVGASARFVRMLGTQRLVTQKGYTIYEIEIYGTMPTDVNERAQKSIFPSEYALLSAYPNPCNLTTTIAYDLPQESNVTLKIFNMLGQEVATLVNTRQIAGHYSKTFDAKNLTSGIYLYRLEAGNYVSAKKVCLLK
jgi:beta-glucosidase